MNAWCHKDPESMAYTNSQGLMDLFQDIVPVDLDCPGFQDVSHETVGNLRSDNLKVHNDALFPVTGSEGIDISDFLFNPTTSSGEGHAQYLNLDGGPSNGSITMDTGHGVQFTDMEMEIDVQGDAANFIDLSSLVAPQMAGDDELKSPFDFSPTDGGDFVIDFGDTPGDLVPTVNEGIMSFMNESGVGATLAGSADTYHDTGDGLKSVSLSPQGDLGGEMGNINAGDVSLFGNSQSDLEADPVAASNSPCGQSPPLKLLPLADLDLLENGTMISEDSELFSLANMKKTAAFVKVVGKEAPPSRSWKRMSPPKLCDTCETWIPNEQAYRNHRRTCHPLPKTEPCKHCGAFYSAKCNLEKHRKSVHGTEKFHTCEVAGCGKQFAEKNKLTKHMDTVHLGLRHFPCLKTGCRKAFSQQSDLNRHLNLVHDKEKRYFCNTCEVDGSKCDFGRRSSLIQHLCRVHEMKRKDAGICSNEGRYKNDFGKLITRAYPACKPRKSKRPRRYRKAPAFSDVQLPWSPVTDEDLSVSWR